MIFQYPLHRHGQNISQLDSAIAVLFLAFEEFVRKVVILPTQFFQRILSRRQVAAVVSVDEELLPPSEKGVS